MNPWAATVATQHSAFLWEYAKRYKLATDAKALGPDFVADERKRLADYRAVFGKGKGLDAANSTLIKNAQHGRPTIGREGDGQAGQQDRREPDIDDATESMKGLGFRDIDMEDTRTLPNPRLPNLRPPPPPAPKPIIPPPKGNEVFVDIKPRPKPAAKNAKAGPSKSRKPDVAATGAEAGGKRKREAADAGEKKTKRQRNVYPAKEEPNTIACLRCMRNNQPMLLVSCMIHGQLPK